MIQSVTVTNPAGELLTLELASPEKSGLQVLEIDGLGPSKANINVSEVATMDGAMFNSSRVTSRNIVMTLGMMESPTIEDSRQLTYKFFPIKKQIKLSFVTDNRQADIVGYVESNEPTIFSQNEKTQISIICPDPFFYSSGDGISAVFSGTDALFEFPFPDSIVEMSEIKEESAGVIYYRGDADIGMVMTIHFRDAATGITIYNLDTRETMYIDTTKVATISGAALGLNDDIIISTVKGQKSAYLLRAGSYTNIINALSKTSNWFQLSKGANSFMYTAETGERNLEFKVDYKLAYEGV